MPTDDLSRFCCQNPDCPLAGQRGQGNLTVCAHYGTGPQRRLLYCRSCKYRFSERKNTPLTQEDLTLVGRLVADLNELREKEPELKLGRITAPGDAFIGKRMIEESIALAPLACLVETTVTLLSAYHAE